MPAPSSVCGIAGVGEFAEDNAKLRVISCFIPHFVFKTNTFLYREIILRLVLRLSVRFRCAVFRFDESRLDRGWLHSLHSMHVKVLDFPVFNIWVTASGLDRLTDVVQSIMRSPVGNGCAAKRGSLVCMYARLLNLRGSENKASYSTRRSDGSTTRICRDAQYATGSTSVHYHTL